MFYIVQSAEGLIYAKEPRWKISSIFWLGFALALCAHLWAIFYSTSLWFQNYELQEKQMAVFSINLIPQLKTKEVPRGLSEVSEVPTSQEVEVPTSQEVEAPVSAAPVSAVPVAELEIRAKLNITKELLPYVRGDPSFIQSKDIGNGLIFDPRLREKFHQKMITAKSYQYGEKAIESYRNLHDQEIIVNNGRCLRVASSGIVRNYFLSKCGFIKNEQEQFEQVFRHALKVKGLK